MSLCDPRKFNAARTQAQEVLFGLNSGAKTLNDGIALLSLGGLGSAS
jgi:hypothetical protein